MKILQALPDGKELEIVLSIDGVLLSDLLIIAPEPEPEPEPEPVNPNVFQNGGIFFYKSTTQAGARAGYELFYGNNPADTDLVGDFYYSASTSFSAADLPDYVPPVKETPQDDEPVLDDPIVGGRNLTKLPGTMSNMANRDGKFGQQNSTHHNRIAIHTRPDGTTRQTYAYWGGRRGVLNSQGGGDGRMVVTQRNFPEGLWGAAKDVHSIVSRGGLSDPTWRKGNFDGTQAMEIDNHNNVSMTVSSSGRVAVTGNHHAHWVKLAISDTDDVNGKWTNYDFNDFEDDPKFGKVNMKRITYPCLFTYKGKIWLSTRGQTSGGGVANAPWYWTLHEFDEGAKKFRHRSTVGYAVGARCYNTNVAVCKLPNGGERMSISANFRNEVEGGSAGHYTLFNMCSDNGVDWFQFNKNNGGTTPINIPAQFSINTNTTTNVPVLIWDTVKGDDKVAAFNTGLDSNHKPVLFVRGRRTGHHVFTHTSNGWIDDRSHNMNDLGRFFNLANGDLACVYRDGTAVKAMSMVKGSKSYGKGVTLSTDVNGSWGANHDPIAAAVGWLSVPIHKGDVAKPNDGYVLTLPISELDL